MKRFEKIALSIGGPIAGAGAVFYAWSANYAAASYFLLKSSTMWKSFIGSDMLMPAKQAWVYLGNPTVNKLVSTASMTTLAQTAVLAGGLTLAIKRHWQVRPPADASRFATLKDLEDAGLLNGKPGKSVLLGTFGKGRNTVDVRYSGDSHFFVNGPSRSGKGRGFVMPNLLEYQGSVIVLDVKLENYSLTAPARLAMGQACYIFAPGSARSHRWNPLDFVRAWPERATDLINLAATLLPIGAKEDGYWKQTARGLLAGVLGYVLESKSMEGRRNFRSVLRMFSTGRSFSAVLVDIIRDEPDLDQFIVDSFRQHLGRDEEQRPSFEGHVTTALAPFNNLLMAEACAESDFDVRDMRRKPFSLFIAAPVSDFGTVEPIIRLLIQQIHDVMLRSLPGKDEPHKILMMLDEFYQFERLPEIIKRAPLVAGYGLTIALVAQNIPQIDERYGQKTRDALLGNMDIKLCIAVGDDATAKIVSANLGRTYEERESWGKQTGLLFGKKASSGRFEAVPLMDPGAVQRLDDNKTILQVRSGYGAILNKMNFYTDQRFIVRRREVEAFQRDLVIPEILIKEESPLFTVRPASEPAPQPASSVGRRPDFEGSAEAATVAIGGKEHDITVMELAREVFVDPSRLVHAYRTAVAASEDQASADLLFRLRTAPETLGDLKGATNLFDAKGLRARKLALAAVWPLRQAIAEARWAAIGRALQERTDPPEVFFTRGTPMPGPTIAPVTEPSERGEQQLAETDRVAPSSMAVEDDEENSLDLGFAELGSAVSVISEIAEQETKIGRVTDLAAMGRALVGLKAGLDRASLEAADVDQLQLDAPDVA
ncbi:type IV secretory system conjugative DNA transfer family protein [Ensifer sp. SL37]|uniref:type IV secretory system conjugative DNA transfer family protein n=1 Tax=Ensifer sp. SL37 TaxID=2995137 RepID=UPI0022769721|nr:type IV secretory system conjugative DNA transfer family protein [Ensifer sp. SL37]MCY1740708.1 type IV secretory system conjugative DNA transfer family protein [Ensifer sp. SL37]